MDDCLEFVVDESEAGRRLDVFLAGRTEDLSRARIKSLIEQGFCLVDGETAKAGLRLKYGQGVRLTVPAPEPADLEPDPEVRFEILYQDADVVVVDKPPGVVVHPAAGHARGTLVHGLLAACPDLSGIGGETRPGIVHRLDKDTSGVMVAAKSERAHRALAEGFKAGRMEKTYLALCRGDPPARQGRIDAPIGRHPVRRKEMSTRSKSGREALTEYRVVERFSAGPVLLEVKILTGRTHQIRVHLSSVGCPVLGDPVYGKGGAGLRGAREAGGLIGRQMLHAFRLGFAHPADRRRLEFEAPLPPDMAAVLKALRTEK